MKRKAARFNSNLGCAGRRCRFTATPACWDRFYKAKPTAIETTACERTYWRVCWSSTMARISPASFLPGGRRQSRPAAGQSGNEGKSSGHGRPAGKQAGGPAGSTERACKLQAHSRREEKVHQRTSQCASCETARGSPCSGARRRSTTLQAHLRIGECKRARCKSSAHLAAVGNIGARPLRPRPLE